MALPLVQKGKFSAGTALLVSTLKNVDFLFGANRVDDDEVEESQADSPDIRQTDDANLERRAKAAEQDALLLFFLLRRHASRAPSMKLSAICQRKIFSPTSPLRLNLKLLKTSTRQMSFEDPKFAFFLDNLQCWRGETPVLVVYTQLAAAR